MTKNSIKQLLTAKPFRPFCFILPKGKRICVDSPDLAEVPNKGNNLVVWENADSPYSVVSLTQIDHIESNVI